jgi:hypothetical protein
MPNYTDEANSVRVDIFKSTGKWYETVCITNSEYANCCIHESVKKALKQVIGDSYKGMTAVCIEPYHENSHPIMFVIK